MNSPAEKDTPDIETVPTTVTDEVSQTAEVSQSERPVERDSIKTAHTPLQPKIIVGGKQFNHTPQPLSAFFQLPLLRDDIFLGILALTILNAFVYFYYATTQPVSLDLKSANMIVRDHLGRDADFYAPISDFVNIHGAFSTPENSEFETSLARFKSRLAKLGIDASDLFFLDEFIQKNGGLYWFKKSDRAPTVYQPVTP